MADGRAPSWNFKILNFYWPMGPELQKYRRAKTCENLQKNLQRLHKILYKKTGGATANYFRYRMLDVITLIHHDVIGFNSKLC